MPSSVTPATADQFRQLFPAFCELADEQIDPWFTEAALRFRSVRFRTQWHMAVYAFTAHQLTVLGIPNQASSEDAGARGQVTSEKVGDLAKSYGAAIDIMKVPPALQHFMSTKYGVMLLSIIMSRSATRGSVVRTGSSRVGAIPGIFGTDGSS